MLVPPSASFLTPESKDKSISGKATAFRAQPNLNDVVREMRTLVAEFRGLKLRSREIRSVGGKRTPGNFGSRGCFSCHHPC